MMKTIANISRFSTIARPRLLRTVFQVSSTILFYNLFKHQFDHPYNRYSAFSEDRDIRNVKASHRVIQLDSRDSIEMLLNREGQGFHLIIVNSAQKSESDDIKIMDELTLLSQNNSEKLKIYFYESSENDDYDYLISKLNKQKVLTVSKSKKMVIITKKDFINKPNIFCGNNSRIRKKIHSYLQNDASFDKFSVIVFYSSTTKESNKKIISELKQNYKKIKFIDISDLNWTNYESTNKIVIVKKFSKYFSFDPKLVNYFDNNTEIKEFTLNNTPYQWIGAHLSKDSVDEMMNKFSVFSLKNDPESVSKKEIIMNFKLNKNKMTTQDFHNILNHIKKLKEFSLKYRPNLVITMEYDHQLKDKIEITAKNLKKLNEKKEIYLTRDYPSEIEFNKNQKIVKNWNKSYLYRLNTKLEYLKETSLINFVDNIFLDKEEEWQQVEKSKPYLLAKKISYYDYTNLWKDDSRRDALVFVYSNNCPGCKALKPIIGNISMINENPATFNNLRIFKLNADKNDGFMSMPKFIYFKHGIPTSFTLNIPLNVKTFSKNLQTYLKLFSKLKLEQKNQFNFDQINIDFKTRDFNKEIDK